MLAFSLQLIFINLPNLLELEDDHDTEVVETIQEQSEKDKYLRTQNMNKPADSSNIHTAKREKRVKRQSDYEYTPTKTRCPLLLVADYRFFQEMGSSNTKTTISYLVSKLYRSIFF